MRKTRVELAGVIFDLDGVVVDSHPVHVMAWKTLFASLGKKVSDGDLSFVLDGHKRDTILRHFLGELGADELKEYGERKATLYRETATELKTIAGLGGFMDAVEAAGLPMAVASSAGRARVEHTLNALGIAKRFRTVVTGDDVAASKPDPAVFQLAARELGVKAESVLVCEDAVAGVEGAKRAAMKCLAIAANGRGPLLKQAGADCVVTDFTQVSLDELRGLFGNQ
ncbi:MAG: HAD family phosphatase [Acidobacteriia bacterium]|nr:HAD family phosphatase [Terriglobia bacterium]